MIPLLVFLPTCFLVVNCEPLNFNTYFDHGTPFFAPSEQPAFETLSDFSFNPTDGIHISPDFHAVSFASETENIPIYTDGVASPPQVTLSQLEKDYTTQLHRLAHSRSSYRPRHYVPKFKSEPFPSASTVDEKKPGFKKPGTSVDSRFAASKPVEIHTGFVPIIRGSSQDRRQKQSLASTVIKDMDPPILTAAPGSLTSRPNLLKVSASILSSAKASTTRQRQNATEASSNEVQLKPTRTDYSRFLNFRNGSRISGISSTSSESVVSRVIVNRPESIPDPLQGNTDYLKSSDAIDVEDELDTKQTLDINCDGSSDLGWCELGRKYPKKYVNQVISACQDIVERMYIEVPHSFEKLSDASDFKAEFDNSTYSSAKERGSHDAWSWAAYFHQGSLCDSETGFLRPETAKDSTGTWNIIVQTDTIKQRVPIEMCRKTNSSCKKMLNCGLKSQCLQKYNYHSLLSLNPTQKHDCPFMKLYRFPSACVCHVE